MELQDVIGRTDDNYSHDNNNITVYDNGTNKHCMDTLQTTKDNKEYPINLVSIYRYKFTKEFTDELFKFSKIHQYDHRKDFKEAWEIWIQDNENLVNIESRRLINLGYDG